MYTCADDVLCCGELPLKCILKEGARRSKRRAAITPETRSQALTTIECILEWGTIHVPSHADSPSPAYIALLSYMSVVSP